MNRKMTDTLSDGTSIAHKPWDLFYLKLSSLLLWTHRRGYITQFTLAWEAEYSGTATGENSTPGISIVVILIKFPTSYGSTCLYVEGMSDFYLKIWHLLSSPQSYDSNFMTKKIKMNSGALCNAKHRISSTPSTICFDLNSIFHYYSIFVLLFISNHRGQNT